MHQNKQLPYMKAIKTVIVDDNPFDLVTLQDALVQEGKLEIIDTYLNGADFLNALVEKELQFDLLLIDYRMPVLNGLDTLRALSTMNITFKVLLVSHGFYKHINQELQKLGFRNYCKKTAKMINAAIPRIMLGVNIYHDISEVNNWEQQTDKQTLKIKDESPWRSLLSPVEIKIIRLLCKGFNSKEIAARLGYEASSIEKYRGLLIKALDLKGSSQMVAWAFSQGIVTPTSIFMESPDDLLFNYRKKDT